MKSTLWLVIGVFGGCMSNQAFVEAGGFAVDNLPEEGPELIINGDFESPQLNPGSWQVYQSIEGWKTSFGPGVEVQHRVAGSPFSGNQHIELDSHASSGIYQDLNTAPGVAYRLSLAFSARPGTSSEDNVLLVVWNGKVLDELTPQGEGWKTYEFAVTASSGVSRLELRDAGPSNSLGTYVDQVSVRASDKAAPEEAGRCLQ